MVLAIILATQLPNYGRNTLIAPLVVVIPLIIFSGIQIYKDIVDIVKNRKSIAPQKTADGGTLLKAKNAGKKLLSAFSVSKPAGVFLWIIIAAACCYFFSILISAFVFINLYFIFVAKVKWYYSILTSLITCSVLYFAFGYFLKVDFFRDTLLFTILRGR